MFVLYNNKIIDLSKYNGIQIQTRFTECDIKYRITAFGYKNIDLTPEISSEKIIKELFFEMKQAYIAEYQYFDIEKSLNNIKEKEPEEELEM